MNPPLHHLKIKLLRENAIAPVRATDGAAGWDLFADSFTRVTTFRYANHFVGRDCEQRHQALIPTGIAVEIPSGFVGLICPRSGLAVTKGLDLANGPGVIDSDYRGEIKVAVRNLGIGEFVCRAGERIGQLVIVPAPVFDLDIVYELSTTPRGSNGFGSTGA